MRTKFQAVCFFYFGLIYFLCQVSLSECQVILVTRNVTDSFRIGQGGCNGNESVCTDRASCQEDGSCLCKKDYPHFRNPTVAIINSTLTYTNSYGCLKDQYIRQRVGDVDCNILPFQVIPNEREKQATNFSHNNVLSCDFQGAVAKYPSSNIQINITSWLNETYLELNIVNNELHFKWRKSVPKLQGSIITIKLYCKIQENGYRHECLRAKVFGTWEAPNPNPSTIQPTANDSANNTSGITIGPTAPTNSGITSTANPSEPGNSSSKEDPDKPDTTIIAVAVVVPLVVVIIIILVVCCLLKRKKNRKTVYKRSTYLNNYDNCHVNRGLFYGPGSDTAVTPADQTTPVKSLTSEYETPDVNIDRNKAIGGSGAVVVTPADQTTPVKILNSEYETPDVNIDRNKVIGGSGAVAVTPADQTTPVKILNSDYETPDVNIDRNKVIGGSGSAAVTPADQTTPVKILNSEYETPDVNIDRNKVNVGSGAAAVTPVDQAAPMKNLKAEYATPDDRIERIEVNGDLYAVVNQKNKKTTEKNNDKPNEVQYMDPQKLALDGVKDEGQPSQPTEYAEISGFLQPVDE